MTLGTFPARKESPLVHPRMANAATPVRPAAHRTRLAAHILGLAPPHLVRSSTQVCVRVQSPVTESDCATRRDTTTMKVNFQRVFKVAVESSKTR